MPEDKNYHLLKMELLLEAVEEVAQEEDDPKEALKIAGIYFIFLRFNLLLVYLSKILNLHY